MLREPLASTSGGPDLPERPGSYNRPWRRQRATRAFGGSFCGAQFISGPAREGEWDPRHEFGSGRLGYLSEAERKAVLWAGGRIPYEGSADERQSARDAFAASEAQRAAAEAAAAAARAAAAAGAAGAHAEASDSESDCSDAEQQQQDGKTVQLASMFGEPAALAEAAAATATAVAAVEAEAAALAALPPPSPEPSIASIVYDPDAALPEPVARPANAGLLRKAYASWESVLDGAQTSVGPIVPGHVRHAAASRRGGSAARLNLCSEWRCLLCSEHAMAAGGGSGSPLLPPVALTLKPLSSDVTKLAAINLHLRTADHQTRRRRLLMEQADARGGPAVQTCACGQLRGIAPRRAGGGAAGGGGQTEVFFQHCRFCKPDYDSSSSSSSSSGSSDDESAAGDATEQGGSGREGKGGGKAKGSVSSISSSKAARREARQKRNLVPGTGGLAWRRALWYQTRPPPAPAIDGPARAEAARAIATAARAKRLEAVEALREEASLVRAKLRRAGVQEMPAFPALEAAEAGLLADSDRPPRALPDPAPTRAATLRKQATRRAADDFQAASIDGRGWTARFTRPHSAAPGIFYATAPRFPWSNAS